MHKYSKKSVVVFFLFFEDIQNKWSKTLSFDFFHIIFLSSKFSMFVYISNWLNICDENFNIFINYPASGPVIFIFYFFLSWAFGN